jgi:hypothetical protein
MQNSGGETTRKSPIEKFNGDWRWMELAQEHVQWQALLTVFNHQVLPTMLVKISNKYLLRITAIYREVSREECKVVLTSIDHLDKNIYISTAVNKTFYQLAPFIMSFNYNSILHRLNPCMLCNP